MEENNICLKTLMFIEMSGVMLQGEFLKWEFTKFWVIFQTFLNYMFFLKNFNHVNIKCTK